MIEPLVSIATPVYNGEPFLRECIESVLAQTYSNWEYAIVDNQSTDRTLEIAREYAERDGRIQVYQNEAFLEAIDNFNNTVHKISPHSTYCKIICADDWIYPECLSKMVQLAESDPRIGIISSYRLFGRKVVPEGMPSRSVFSGREMGRMNLLEGPYTFGSPSALLIRSEILRAHDPFYNPSHLSADTEACYQILKEWGFGFVHQILTYERIHDKSIGWLDRNLSFRIPNHMHILQQHGQAFLEKEEYDRELHKISRVYYRRIGENLFKRGNREFMEFHKHRCRSLNLPFNRVEILRGWFRAKLSMIVDTKEHLRRLRAKFFA